MGKPKKKAAPLENGKAEEGAGQDVKEEISENVGGGGGGGAAPPAARKRGRPRKVVLVVQEHAMKVEYKNSIHTEAEAGQLHSGAENKSKKHLQESNDLGSVDNGAPPLSHNYSSSSRREGSCRRKREPKRAAH